MILRELADGRFHSGTDLGASLGLTRAAVWKQVRQLGGLGVNVQSVRGKGYRLAAPIELLDVGSIREDLGDDAASRLARIEVHPVLDSTNSHLMSLARTEPVSASVCLAEHQRQGRGRHGRSWQSPFGASLYMSLLWSFECGPGQLTGLSLAAGSVIAQVLEGLGADAVALKWPNDVFCDGRKLGGILVEVAGEASGPCHIVLGIGVNGRLAQDVVEGIDQPVTDLMTATGGRCTSRNRLAAELLNALVPLLADYESTGLAPYRERWSNYNMLHGKQVTVFTPGGEQVGQAMGIDDDGALLVDCGGTLKRFNGGEVSLRQAP